MSLLGWLTKPTLEVSLLDRLICFGEIMIVLVVIAYIFGKEKK